MEKCKNGAQKFACSIKPQRFIRSRIGWKAKINGKCKVGKFDVWARLVDKFWRFYLKFDGSKSLVRRSRLWKSLFQARRLLQHCAKLYGLWGLSKGRKSDVYPLGDFNRFKSSYSLARQRSYAENIGPMATTCLSFTFSFAPDTIWKCSRAYIAIFGSISGKINQRKIGHNCVHFGINSCWLLRFWFIDEMCKLQQSFPRFEPQFCLDNHYQTTTQKGQILRIFVEVKRKVINSEAKTELICIL